MATLILNVTEEQIITINQLAAAEGKSTHEFVIGRALAEGGRPMAEAIVSSTAPVVIETKGEEAPLVVAEPRKKGKKDAPVDGE